MRKDEGGRRTEEGRRGRGRGRTDKRKGGEEDQGREGKGGNA